MTFRKQHNPRLFKLIPSFNFCDLMELSIQIEISRSEKNDFWKEYDQFWVMFGYDELFSPWEYARAFADVYIRKRIDSRNQIMLLRLSRTDLLGSYDGVDGVYYFLFTLERCIKKGINPTRLEFWMLDGLRMYENKKEINSFCHVNSITL